jgi:beta-D-xylosidase 4
MRNMIVVRTSWLLPLAIDVVSSACLPPYAATTTYVGCYQDPLSPRDLSGPLLTVGNLNSPQYCANICDAAGYSYGGVEYTVCWYHQVHLYGLLIGGFARCSLGTEERGS